jgi:hypothetical protein
MAGTYRINTGATPPVLTKPDDTTIDGVVFDPNPSVTGDEIAVLTFDTIAGGSSVTITAEGPRPVALLSHDAVTLTGGGGRIAFLTCSGTITTRAATTSSWQAAAAWAAATATPVW